MANPGTGWGGTDIADPLAIVEGWEPETAWPGLRLLMVSTTGEHAEWYVLDDALKPQRATFPEPVPRIVHRIGENCEASLCTVLFVGGAGGSLRAGVTENPVLLTRSIKDSLVNVTCGGAPAYVWPGGGITVMVDVARMPEIGYGTFAHPLRAAVARRLFARARRVLAVSHFTAAAAATTAADFRCCVSNHFPTFSPAHFRPEIQVSNQTFAAPCLVSVLLIRRHRLLTWAAAGGLF